MADMLEHGNMRLPRKWTLRGQTTAEYAILVFFVVITLIGAIEALRIAALDYYFDIVAYLCLPIP